MKILKFLLNILLSPIIIPLIIIGILILNILLFLQLTIVAIGIYFKEGTKGLIKALS